MTVIERIRELKTAQAYLLTSQINVLYASGFTGDSSEFLITGAGAVFFTDSRYTLQAERQLNGLAQVITTSGKDRSSAIKSALTGIKTLAIEKTDVSMQRYGEFETDFDVESYVDISDALLTMRAVKTEEEVRKIEIAARASEKALTELLQCVRPGISELDIRAELVYQINRQGMESAFDPIVAGGENSALPHAQPGAYKLRRGDMLTLDFGCRYEGYCSDMTRTFGIGQVDGELKRIYDVVKRAQQRALDVSQAEQRDEATHKAEIINIGEYLNRKYIAEQFVNIVTIHERTQPNTNSTIDVVANFAEESNQSNENSDINYKAHNIHKHK